MIYIVSPMNIKYSVRGTEKTVYTYAEYLYGRGMDVTILTSRKYGSKDTASLNRDTMKAYDSYIHLPQRDISCMAMKTGKPFESYVSFYPRLPADGTVYMPASIYDYLPNVMLKRVMSPRTRFLIGEHSLQFMNIGDMRRINIYRKVLNSIVKPYFGKRDIYHHVVNRTQIDYLASLGADRGHIFYVPNFINTDIYSIGERRKDKFVVLHIGGLGKDSYRVVDICRELIRRNEMDGFVFYFIDKNQPPSLRSLARRHMGNIVHLEPYTQAMKRKVLGFSDAIICPALETSSVTMLEGLVSGAAALVDFNYNPFAKEVRALGAPVYDMRNEDISTYVDKLIYLRDNRSSPGKGRKRTRELIRDNFDRGVILPRIRRMFLEVDGKR